MTISNFRSSSPKTRLILLTVILLSLLIISFFFLSDNPNQNDAVIISNTNKNKVPKKDHDALSLSDAPTEDTAANKKTKKTSVVAFTIIKKEQDYLVDWVKYHLAYGFDRIYLYENEDEPFYAKLLVNAGVQGVRSSACAMQWPVVKCPADDNIGDDDSVKVVVKHSPKYLYASKIKNKLSTGPQFMMCDDFDLNYAHIHKSSHVTHFDIDEYIVLKKHNNINEFVNEYLPPLVKVVEANNNNNISSSKNNNNRQSTIINSNNNNNKNNNSNNEKATTKCGAMYLHWYAFGDSHLTKPDKSIPVPIRFTMRGRSPHPAGKVIYRTDAGRLTVNPHSIDLREGSLCNTNGQRFEHTFENASSLVTVDVLQLNHYYTKTWEEFKYFKMRGRSSTIDMDFSLKDYERYFNLANQNDVVDTRAAELFKILVNNNNDMNESSITTTPSP